MEDKLYRDEAWLREQYSVNKRSSINIALEAECSFSTILFWLDKFGIPRNDYTDERRSRQIEYNKTRIFSEKTREKISIGNKVPKHTPEARKKMSETRKGHPYYGKPPSAETRQKISNSLIGRKRSHYKKRSPECGRHHGEMISGENHPCWKGGISFEPYCRLFTKALREQVRERFGRKCFLCNKTETECGRLLDVHHVDYNKNTLCNGKSWPLIPLCSSDHHRTNWHRYYWFNLLINYWAANTETNFNPPEIWAASSI